MFDGSLLNVDLPIYRVSPQSFVTNEHMASDIASTSCSSPSPSPFLPFALPFGVFFLSLGVFSFGSSALVARLADGVWSESCSGVVFLEEESPPSCSRSALFFSTNLFSKVWRSMPSESLSADNIPDSRRSVSIRPRRFSRPSIYFALYQQSVTMIYISSSTTYPFGGFRFFSTCVNIHSVL
jgi:hypothetical protein